MNTMDYVQLAMLLLALLVALCGALNRWAVANHRDRLASLTSAAGNAAGRIREALSGLPANADAQQIKRELVERAAPHAARPWACTSARSALIADTTAVASFAGSAAGSWPSCPSIMPTTFVVVALIFGPVLSNSIIS